MLYPLKVFRSIGMILTAILIIVLLQDDFGLKRATNCQVEAIKVIEFFNKVFSKNPDPDMMDTDEDDGSDNGRLQEQRDTSTTGSIRRRLGDHDQIAPIPWRIFDFGIHGTSDHHSDKAIIVKRHALYSGKKQWKRNGEFEDFKENNKAKQTNSLSDNDDEADVKKLQKVDHKDGGKVKQHNETEKSKKSERKKMDKRSESRDDKLIGKERRKLASKEKSGESEEIKKFRNKGNKNIKVSLRVEEDEGEEEQVIEEDLNPEKVTKQKQVGRKRKPWLWSRRYKSPDDEPMEESYFQKRLNKRIGDIESWKRMIYCKFNPNASECSRNETSTNTIDFFGKFKKFTKRPSNRSTTPASNNATSPASTNGTTGFTDGSTTEWTRPTTTSFDEGRFATNGTTMAIPTRSESTTSATTTTTGQPTPTTSATTTTSGSTTTTQAPTTSTTQSSTTTTQGSITFTQTTPAQTTTGQSTTTGLPTTTQSTTTTTSNTSQPSTITQATNVRRIPSNSGAQDITKQTNPPAPNNQPFTLIP